jgi:nucleotide-binding universal stress UspA family protein
MEGIKRILVGCDFSEYSARIVKFAVQLASQLGAELIVLNVVNKRDVEAIERVEREYPAISAEKYLDDLKKERSRLMDDLLRETGLPRISVTKIVRAGVPFRTILEVVAEEKADLVVMGTRGRSNLAGVLFGSTAEKVFRRCPVTLVSVRSEETA